MVIVIVLFPSLKTGALPVESGYCTAVEAPSPNQ